MANQNQGQVSADEARNIWDGTAPWERETLVPNMHPLAYGANYGDLSMDERTQVKDGIAATRTVGRG